MLESFAPHVSLHVFGNKYISPVDEIYKFLGSFNPTKAIVLIQSLTKNLELLTVRANLSKV